MPGRLRFWVFGIVGFLLIGVVPNAHAQRMGLRITPEGLETMSSVAMALAPRTIETDNLDAELRECEDSRVISAHLPPIEISLNYDEIALAPADGAVTAHLVFDVSAAADEVFLNNPYACFGEETCDVHASIDDLEVDLTLGLMTSARGQIELSSADIALEIDDEDLNVTSEGCAIGEVAQWLIEAVKSWALERGVPHIEMLLEERVAETIAGLFEETLALEVDYSETLNIRASLDAIEIDSQALDVLGDAVVTYSGTPVFDEGPPDSQNAEGPAFRSGSAAQGDFQVALSDQAVNEALYEAWRGGVIQRLLRTPVANPRIDLSGVGAIQQVGLPAGTNLEIAADIESPLEIRFGRSAPNETQLFLRGLRVVVDVRAPETAAFEVEAVVNARAEASLRLDPGAGGVGLDIGELQVESIQLIGEGDEFEFDGARFERFIERTVTPLLAERLAELPVAPALFNVFGYFIALRGVESEDGWQRLGIDVHQVDESDTAAPETSIDTTPELLSAGATTFEISGSDNSTPESLLRFRAWLDEEAIVDEPSSIRLLSVDAANGEHTLRVAAVDLNGNEDPTPAEHRFRVDGTPPTLTLTQVPEGVLEANIVSASWEAADGEGEVSTRWELRKIPASGQPETVAQSERLGASSSITYDELENGELYELLIIAEDEAGNLASQGIGFSTNPGGGCACSVPGRSSRPVMWALALVGLVMIRRRFR